MFEIPRASADDLLAHAGWVRGLAQSLVRGDAAAADDVVQETWLAALRRPPAKDRPLQPWLASVVRNFASSRVRQEAARAGREADAGSAERPEAQIDGRLEAERLEMRANVVEALVGLREPYRTTLLLRYYGGLEPSDIAARQGIPAATVRTRLRRGLRELRARVENRWSDAETTALQALCLVAEGSSALEAGAAAGSATAGSATTGTATTAATFSAVLGSAWTMLLAGVLAVIGVSWIATRERAANAAEPAAVPPGMQLARSAAELPLEAGAPERVAVAGAPAGALAELAGAPAVVEDGARFELGDEELEALAVPIADGALEGIVLAGREPLSGVEVVLVEGARLRLDDEPESWPDDVRIERTDALGIYRFDDAPSSQYNLAISVDGKWRQAVVRLPPGAERRRTVWAIGSSAIEGHVWDSQGRPVAGVSARIQFEPMGRALASFHAWGVTDEAGRFRIAALPGGTYRALAKSQQHIGDDWFNDTRRVLEVAPGATATVDFGSPGLAPELVGRVRTEAGEALIANATVHMTHVETGIQRLAKYEQDGTFRLALSPGRYEQVCLVPPGPSKKARIALADIEMGAADCALDFVVPGTRVLGHWQAWASAANENAQLIACARSSAGVLRAGPIQADGSFVLDGLAAGTWSIWIEKGQQASDATQPQTFEVPAGAPSLILDL